MFLIKILRDMTDPTLIIGHLYSCIRLTLDRQTFNNNLLVRFSWQTK